MIFCDGLQVRPLHHKDTIQKRLAAVLSLAPGLALLSGSFARMQWAGTRLRDALFRTSCGSLVGNLIPIDSHGISICTMYSGYGLRCCSQAHVTLHAEHCNLQLSASQEGLPL